MENKILKLFLRFVSVTCGALLLALNLSTFVHKAGLLPGGFTGIVLLVQEIFSKYLHIKIPFSLFYWILNFIPAAICFKYVGKKFTILSIWMIVASGFFTDLITTVFPDFYLTNDVMLSSVFGGILQGFSISLALLAGATSGGTDFISIIVSEKTGRSSWNAIFAGNCILLVVFGLLFGWNRALYSIIFQYVSTQVLNLLYRRYQKTTLLIVTEKTGEIVKIIKDMTNHDATLFEGTGCYSGAKRKLLYCVVSSSEAEKLSGFIKAEDPDAFINVLQTKNLYGRFFIPKND